MVHGDPERRSMATWLRRVIWGLLGLIVVPVMALRAAP
jgi:hypothetical protein